MDRLSGAVLQHQGQIGKNVFFIIGYFLSQIKTYLIMNYDHKLCFYNYLVKLLKYLVENIPHFGLVRFTQIKQYSIK